MFEEHLGEAKSIYDIIRDDVRSFKQALSDLPVNFSGFPVSRFPMRSKPIEAGQRPTRT